MIVSTIFANIVCARACFVIYNFFISVCDILLLNKEEKGNAHKRNLIWVQPKKFRLNKFNLFAFRKKLSHSLSRSVVSNRGATTH